MRARVILPIRMPHLDSNEDAEYVLPVTIAVIPPRNVMDLVFRFNVRPPAVTTTWFTINCPNDVGVV